MARFAAMLLVPALFACERGRDEHGSRDGGATGFEDARTSMDAHVTTRRAAESGSPMFAVDAGPQPPAECVAPCLWELMRHCSAPKKMHTCYRDGDGGTAAYCDPVTGWSLTYYNEGSAGYGYRLAHDGMTCLQSGSGGRAFFPGILYLGMYPNTPAVQLESDGQTTTLCGYNMSAPQYAYAGDAACSAWQTNPLHFECDEIVPGSCPPPSRTIQ